jgi:uncharacterized protein (DUF427 family)
MKKPQRMKPAPGQESVWDYPRPPRLEQFSGSIEVVFNGVIVARTRSALRVLETSHPPVYYLPPADVRRECLHPLRRLSYCEWKGSARYFDLRVGKASASAAAWAYSNPSPEFAPLADHVAFYAALMDVCTVNGERVLPQPGRFYGGWITSNIVGPFKGEPGSEFW